MGCELCPRACGVNRREGEAGICCMDSTMRIARASLHQWEEPCLSGTNGSGTVFFSGCPLHCVYCQNYRIAAGDRGVPVSVSELRDIFLKLQAMGAHNINLVTPTHFVPAIAEALQQAKAAGLTLPIVYNTSSYETVNTLSYMDGLVDIYLPDLKYFSPALAEQYSSAPDYFQTASAAIAEMYRQAGDPVFREDGMLQSGVLVRHLLLPGQVRDSKRVVRYLWKTYHDHIFLSLMCQYTPLPHVAASYPELARRVTQEEYDELVDYAVDLGITQAYTQEMESASESFIPAFESFSVSAFLNAL